MVEERNWEKVQLGDILSVRHGKSQHQVVNSNGVYPIFGTGGLMGWADEFLYDKPSVLIGRKGTINRPQYFDKPFWTIDTLFYTEINKNVSAKYIYYLFNTIDWYSHNEASGVPSLNSKVIEKISILLPSLEEQKVIAKALTDTDNLIHSMEKLIDKKEKIKKGTMQELLTGKKRLDGFSGEWGKSKIGDLCTVLRGKIITEANSVDGDIPVIAGGTKPSYYHNIPNRTGKTITISGSGANAGYIGFHDIPIYASDCLTISEQDDKYNIEFIYYRLILIQEKIYYMQTGGAQPHIYPKDIEPIEIRLPSLEEQKAISQILSDMDQEIQGLKEKLEKYKTIKQGIMQELLTGRVRLI